MASRKVNDPKKQQSDRMRDSYTFFMTEITVEVAELHFLTE